jgi:hypothetical protein
MAKRNKGAFEMRYPPGSPEDPPIFIDRRMGPPPPPPAPETGPMIPASDPLFIQILKQMMYDPKTGKH